MSKEQASLEQSRSFSLIDAMKTLFDFVVYNIGIFVLALSPVPANLLSATVAMVFSLKVSRKFAFSPGLKRRFSQVLLLLLVAAFGFYVLQSAVIYFLIYVWTLPLELVNSVVVAAGLDIIFSRNFIFANTAKLLATLISVTSNFVLYRHLKFSSQRLEFIDKAGDWLAGNRDILVLVGILFLAALLRLWQLPTLPPGLHSNEAAGGLNALSILDGDLRLFYGNGHIREGLFAYMQTIGVVFFGNTILALRIVPAIMGVGAVLLTFLAAKEWFSMRVALVAAFFMAISPWALHLSRSGYQEVLLLLIVPLLMLAAARAIRTNSAKWWVIAGVVLGIGFYTHVSYYAIVLLLLAVGTFAWFHYRRHLKYLKQPLTIVALSTCLVLLPMFLFVLTNPSSFFDRSGELSLFDSARREGNIVYVLADNTADAAGMLHFRGDVNYGRNLGGEAQLNIFVGILLVLGIMLALKRWRDIRYAVLLLAMPVLALPVLLTVNADAPNSLLAASVVPIIYILAAIGLIELYARWRGVFPHNPLAYNFALLVIVMASFTSAVYTYQRYFIAWANAPETYSAYNEQSVAIASHMKMSTAEAEYIIAIDARRDLPLRYLTDSYLTYERIDINQLDSVSLAAGQSLIVPNLTDSAEADLTQYDCEEHESPRVQGKLLFVECTI